MKRCCAAGLLIFAVFAAPALGQETIRGFLEPPVIDDCKPNSSNCERKPGVVRVVGWALAATGVDRVVIQVDGVDVGQAIYGQPRPLVEDLHPGFPDSAAAGFGYNLNASDFPNGIHEITAKLLTDGGTEVILPAVDAQGRIHADGVQEAFWIYNTATLHPFGKIDVPDRNAELRGTCDRNNPLRRYSVVSGWALDLGIETGDSGIGWVELLVDGVIVANSRTGCFFSPDPAAGGLTNCYGLQRLDIERRYPFAIDAPTAGFRFVLDVGFLLDNGFVEGSHTLTIRAGDISTQTRNVDEFPVNFFCLENLPNEESFGLIENPRPGRQFADSINFVGWALDGEGVDRVEIYVDGNFIGVADFGVGQGTRPEVTALYPGYLDSAFPVWRLRGFDSRQLSDGFHQVQAVVFDLAGDETLIGEETFFVNNEFD